jgi:hypothetical protein
MDTLALAPLLTFRTALAGCFGRRRDALFELVDALLTADDRSSLARLSLTPLHRRKWGSVYAALRRGQVQAEALRDLLARQVALAGPLTFAVDVSIWPRPDAETSPERGYQYFPAALTSQEVVEIWRGKAGRPARKRRVGPPVDTAATVCHSTTWEDVWRKATR